MTIWGRGPTWWSVTGQTRQFCELGPCLYLAKEDRTVNIAYAKAQGPGIVQGSQRWEQGSGFRAVHGQEGLSVFRMYLQVMPISLEPLPCCSPSTALPWMVTSAFCWSLLPHLLSLNSLLHPICLAPSASCPSFQPRLDFHSLSLSTLQSLWSYGNFWSFWPLVLCASCCLSDLTGLALSNFQVSV